MSDRSTAIGRFRDSDMWWSFRRSPLTIVAALVTLVYFIGAVFAPWVAPFDPFDVKSLNLMDAFTPPARPSIRWAPTTRDATCCRPSSTAAASRS